METNVARKMCMVFQISDQMREGREGIKTRMPTRRFPTHILRRTIHPMIALSNTLKRAPIASQGFANDGASASKRVWRRVFMTPTCMTRRIFCTSRKRYNISHTTLIRKSRNRQVIFFFQHSFFLPFLLECFLKKYVHFFYLHCNYLSKFTRGSLKV